MHVFMNTKFTELHLVINCDFILTDTKETAYVQAITAAGIVYSIARACSREDIRQCSCDNTDRAPPEDGDFQWGGCGDNLQHGYNYAKRFAGYALSGDASSLLNGHNSEAGRLVSKQKILSMSLR